LIGEAALKARFPDSFIVGGEGWVRGNPAAFEVSDFRYHKISATSAFPLIPALFPNDEAVEGEGVQRRA
jgi:hypothetical protein